MVGEHLCVSDEKLQRDTVSMVGKNSQQAVQYFLSVKQNLFMTLIMRNNSFRFQTTLLMIAFV